jgi:hypothetical protein
MAVQRYTINGYGQLELNNCAFRRTGRIEAQCALDSTDFTTSNPAENGMILAVNNVARKIKKDATGNFPVALNYTTEHMCDDRKDALKDFCLVPADGFYPRLGYLAVGDKFTTNCFCYDTSLYANDAAVDTAVTASALGTTPVYGKLTTTGVIQLIGTVATTAVGLVVTKATTMPDGQTALQFQVLKA